MKISELMTPDPVTCLPSTNLAQAAALMLQGDCGILPVVENGKLRGVVTDRDLVEAGIIDPTKVVRLALENAVSAAGTLLLTEVTMTEVPEPKPDTPALDAA